MLQTSSKNRQHREKSRCQAQADISVKDRLKKSGNNRGEIGKKWFLYFFVFFKFVDVFPINVEMMFLDPTDFFVKTMFATLNHTYCRTCISTLHMGIK